MQFHSLALLTSTVCAISVQAQETPQFAVIDVEYLAANTAQGKRLFAEAQALRTRLENDLRAKAEELQRLEQQARSSSINEEGRARAARELQDGEIAIQRMREDSEAQLRRASQTAQQQFESEIFPIIEAVAKEQKLLYVLHVGVVLWADASTSRSFTEEVAKRYDAAYPGTAVAAPRTNTPNPGRSESASRSATK